MGTVCGLPILRAGVAGGSHVGVVAASEGFRFFVDLIEPLNGLGARLAHCYGDVRGAHAFELADCESDAVLGPSVAGHDGHAQELRFRGTLQYHHRDAVVEHFYHIRVEQHLFFCFDAGHGKSKGRCRCKTASRTAPFLPFF